MPSAPPDRRVSLTTKIENKRAEIERTQTQMKALMQKRGARSRTRETVHDQSDVTELKRKQRQLKQELARLQRKSEKRQVNKVIVDTDVASGQWAATNPAC